MTLVACVAAGITILLSNKRMFCGRVYGRANEDGRCGGGGRWGWPSRGETETKEERDREVVGGIDQVITLQMLQNCEIPQCG